MKGLLLSLWLFVGFSASSKSEEAEGVAHKLSLECAIAVQVALNELEKINFEKLTAPTSKLYKDVECKQMRNEYAIYLSPRGKGMRGGGAQFIVDVKMRKVKDTIFGK
ncbi:hypothetical protein [Pseudoalteromonas ardens]|uniref:Uncharacterized protein n=1 Tax=Pseudoalteromonas rubra TaxID=43658 RepID=A0A0L0ES07_9GAMM|nr:hypothetical protein [Pseudoalteromonas sp. R96]KNC67140.1 hypothetical protein AC626_12750 [Pseudoalteromonas rubra]MDK1314258.1 hypothetical protein [Pseudoalteromonas sp. R96]